MLGTNYIPPLTVDMFLFLFHKKTFHPKRLHLQSLITFPFCMPSLTIYISESSVYTTILLPFTTTAYFMFLWTSNCTFIHIWYRYLRCFSQNGISSISTTMTTAISSQVGVSPLKLHSALFMRIQYRASFKAMLPLVEITPLKLVSVSSINTLGVKSPLFYVCKSV